MLISVIACVKRVLGLGPKATNPGAAPLFGASETPPAGTQPTPFVAPFYIAPSGLYPVSGADEPSQFTLAMIHIAVGTSGQSPFNAFPADGRVMIAGDNQEIDALYSIILNQFGGAPPSFALPDLRGCAPIGVGQGRAGRRRNIQCR